MVEGGARAGTMTSRVGVTCPVTVRLLAGTGWCGKGSLGRPSWEGSSRGRGSVAQASKLEPDEKELTGSRAPHSPVNRWSPGGDDYTINKS
ncbi:hypothetical protein TIFTF001_039513 [Ficus carica]|uniref:Uncharacterized protein n=1 Tax=Ficus carica TaxID=3494 RepID=A0AA88E9W5_FICCA|nr:hypothetical protein TIFTF001_039490 [Ficus carica]GMN70455.1 hypothetical protein TIFTF001_039497 [Ficus carica]GMN70456.1 hypothetical protein TIFTF001_039506 [Ficus carica]GMN70471.1 hypothetical protein TIFTF001_039513 [Ficus carica]